MLGAASEVGYMVVSVITTLVAQSGVIGSLISDITNDLGHIVCTLLVTNHIPG